MGVDGMLGDALRYPVRDAASRDASAYATAVVLAVVVLLDLAAGLWPSWVALAPTLLAVGPPVLLVGHLTAILRDTATGAGEAVAFRFTRTRARLGVRSIAISTAYLLVPGLLVAGGGYLIAFGSIPSGVAGLAASIIVTVALLVVVSFAYLLPGAVTVGALDGVRAALRRSALAGLASASYFVAWTGTAVLIVLAWGSVSLTAAGSLVGILAVVWFTYAHLAAARLLGRGLVRVHE